MAGDSLNLEVVISAHTQGLKGAEKDVSLFQDIVDEVNRSTDRLSRGGLRLLSDGLRDLGDRAAKSAGGMRSLDQASKSMSPGFRAMHKEVTAMNEALREQAQIAAAKGSQTPQADAMAAVNFSEKDAKLVERYNEAMGVDGTKAAKSWRDEQGKNSQQLALTNQYLHDQEKALQRQAHQAKTSEESIISLRYANYDLARTLLSVSAAITGVGIAATAAFAQMESGFTKVERTTGLYGSALDPVTDQLLELSRVLPVTTSEIQDLAARGAQMGIAADEVGNFAEVMAKFVATSPEVDVNSIAESFGRLSNLTGTDDFQALASSIAQVGVNSAATDAQIIKTTQEMARATNATSLTADEVIGLAAAFASLGVAPEASRGVMNQFFTQLDKGAAGMNDSLAVAGQIMGVTQEEATRLFKTDAGTFFQQFVTGLSGIDNISVALAEMGLSGQRLLPAFKALAQDSERNAQGQSVLAKALQDANQGFVERNELERQYAPIADDLNSRLVLLGNAFMELAYKIGLELAPSIKAGVDAFSGLIQGISDFISSPIGAALTRIATVVASAVAGWAALRGAIALATASTYAFSFVVRGIGGVGIIAGLSNLAKAFRGVGTAGKHGATGVLTLRGALLALGRAVVVGAILSYISEWLFNTGAAAQQAGEFFLWLADTIDHLTQKLGPLGSALIGFGNASGGGALRDIGSFFLDISKNAPRASSGIEDISLNMGDLGGVVEDLEDQFGSGADSAEDFGGALGGAGDAAKEAAKEVRTLLDYASDLSSVWSRAFDIRFSGQSTRDAITSTLISLQEAAEKSAKSIRDLRLEIRKMQADLQGLQNDIRIQEYFLGIAIEYGDTQRAAAIEANLAKMRADLAKQTEDLANKQRELKAEQAAASTTLVGNSKAAVENRNSIRGLVEQYQAHLEALAASGMSQEDLARATAALRADFIRQATQLGYNRSELNHYAKAFDDVAFAIAHIPRDVTIDINNNPALTALRELQAAANDTADAMSRIGSGGGGGGFPGGGGLPRPTPQKPEPVVVPFKPGPPSIAGLNEWIRGGSMSVEDAAKRLGVSVEEAYALGIRNRDGTNVKNALTDALYSSKPSTDKASSEGGKSGGNKWVEAGSAALRGSYGSSLARSMSAGKRDTDNQSRSMGTSAGSTLSLASAGQVSRNFGSRIAGGMSSGRNSIRDRGSSIGTSAGSSLISSSRSQVDKNFGSRVSGVMSSSPFQSKAFSIGSSIGSFLRSGVISSLDFLLGGRNTKARKAVRAVVGFQSGGFTGPGRADEVAGLVHAGEYVIPKRDVNQSTGLPNADALGRLLTGVGSSAKPAASSSSGSSGAGVVDLSANSVRMLAQAVQTQLIIDGKMVGEVASRSYAAGSRAGAN